MRGGAARRFGILLSALKKSIFKAAETLEK
jgi:hypothetical protein